jgi:glycosyltransferase involved in cell wall biosynthesis
VAPVEDPLSWADRERGVVVLGRLDPDKRALDAIEIVEGVRGRGHDLHLHLAGTASPTYRSYITRVEAAVAERDWAHLERDADRDRVETLLRTHRYGLNAKRQEHFGTAVAEYVAAGMVAFAPADGGQVEVLDGRADRLFGSVPDAVDTIDAAVRTDARPTLHQERFAPERFRAALAERVEERLVEAT